MFTNFNKKTVVLLLINLFSFSIAAFDVTNGNDSVLRLRHINEFDFMQSKSAGINEGGIYTLKSEPNERYLIKFSQKDAAVSDFTSAFILRTLVGDRAPLNYLVKSHNGDIALASRFIKGFRPIADYLEELSGKDVKLAGLINKGCSTKVSDCYLPPKCHTDHRPFKDIFYSKEKVEANMLANLINQRDFHYGNVGFILQDNNRLTSAVIDFDNSLGRSPGRVFIPDTRYYAGIEHALMTLRLICSFNPDSLDQLYPLFKKIGSETQLYEIKKIVKDNLIDFKKQITACERAQKILAGETSNESFDLLLDFGDYLDNFTSEKLENPVMNILYEKNDIMRIRKALSANIFLIPSFVHYCLKYNRHDLLENVAVSLDKLPAKNIIETVLEKSQTIKDLECLLRLIEEKFKNPQYHQDYCLQYGTQCRQRDIDYSRDKIKRAYNLLKDFLFDKAFDGNKAFSKKSNLLFDGFDIDMLSKLGIMWLSGCEKIAPEKITEYVESIGYITTEDKSVVNPDYHHYHQKKILDKLIENNDFEAIKKYLIRIKNNSDLLKSALFLLFWLGELNTVIDTLKDIEDPNKLNDIREYIISNCDKKDKVCTLQMPAFTACIDKLSEQAQKSLVLKEKSEL